MQFQGLVYEPLYHAREIATIKLSSVCSCKAKLARISNVFIVFNETIIPLVLVESSHIERALGE